MNFGFFGPKMAVSWRTTAFQKKGPETPIFIVFFGFRLFGPRCPKREILKSHPKKKKILTDNWKGIFWYFCCFFWGFVFFLFFCFFFCSLFFVFLGGFKGQVRWPEGPPHLALNPPYFCFFVFFGFFVLFFCFVFLLLLEGLRVRWGGPKGHLTWP